MLKSKHKVIKVVGYAVIGFLMLLIGITFVLPSVGLKFGASRDAYAVVNGDEISHYDFVRLAQRYMGENSDKMDFYTKNYILNEMISNKILFQKAVDEGVNVSDEKIYALIEDIKGFQDKQGNFQSAYMNSYLSSVNMTFNEFFSQYKESLIVSYYRNMYYSGMGVSPEEVEFENAVNNSKVLIKLAFLSNNELRKRIKNRINVTDAEVQAEMKANPDDLKDPKKDKEIFRKKLESKKFDAEKKKMIKDINTLAAQKVPFTKTAAMFKTKVKISKAFKVGETVKEVVKSARPLYSLSSSEGFIRQCLALKPGISSTVIETTDGIYLFTPVMKQFQINKNISEKDQEKIAGTIARNNYNRLFNQNVIMKEWEQSKIIRNVVFKQDKKAANSLVQPAPTVKRSK